MQCKAFCLTLFLCLIIHFQTISNSIYGSPDGATVIPFKLIGNMIFVEATVNGITGDFLLDTGSPDLLLNSAYFKGIPSQLSIMDLNGLLSPLEHYIVEEMTLQDYQAPVRFAFIMDLQSLEKVKNIPISGIIGYAVLKQVELLFDFENQQITLFSLDKRGRRISSIPFHGPMDSFDLKMCGHLTYLTAKQNGKKLKLGIDSGSEINILHKKSFKKKSLTMQFTANLMVRGIQEKYMPCGKGMFENLTIDDWEAAPMEMALADLYLMNENLDVKLDGLLGAPFLMQGKVSINFKKKRLYMRHSSGETLANKNTPAGERSSTKGFK